jgi:hypothetical protein
VDLSRPLLEPTQQFLEVAAHVEVVIDPLKLPSVFVDISLKQVAETLSLLVKNVLEEIYCRFNLVKDVQEKF